MDWNELLTRFRKLGGVAENVRLGVGAMGRGLFVIDPLKPVHIFVPENLLVPFDDVEILGGQMIAKEGAHLGESERLFFNDYQRYYCWGAGVSDDLRQRQQQWSELPRDLIDMLRRTGRVVDFRFLEATDEVCLLSYVKCYSIPYPGKGRTCIFPVGELINHCGRAPAYNAGGGISVNGRFADEVLARYSNADCWEQAIGLGFIDSPGIAHSIVFDVTINGERRLMIDRTFRQTKIRDGISFPELTEEDGMMRLSYLTLGMTSSSDQPREIFRTIARDLSIEAPDVLWSAIQNYNRVKFIALLRRLDGLNGEVVGTLRHAIYNQLESMS